MDPTVCDPQAIRSKELHCILEGALRWARSYQAKPRPTQTSEEVKYPQIYLQLKILEMVVTKHFFHLQFNGK